MIRERGQVLPLAIVVVALVLINTLLIISGSMIFSQNAYYSLQSAQALNLAEAGVDKAINSMNTSGSSYSGEEETVFGSGSFSVNVTTVDANTKVIESTGYVPSKDNPKAKRTVKISASKGAGVSFKYGIQVGEGGLELGSSNQISGSLYSNGNITAINNNVITGDVWIAAGTSPNADQSTDCEDISCADFIFGKNISGEDRSDVAQGFRQQSTTILNKVSVKLKKIGSPADINVKILGDNDGSPNKNAVLASGVLYSSLVTGSYDWVDVTFANSPNLAANTPYWIMLDTTPNSSNYWSWQQDLSQSYSSGQPKWSSNWQAGNAVWNTVLSDLSFKTYIGGSLTYIDGTNGFTVRGDAHANTIKNITIIGDAYYQSILNSTAQNYYPGSADPAPKSFPISDGVITQWKQQAEISGVTTGDISACQSILGPGKIAGNVTFDTKCRVTIRSPLWITGDLTLKNNNTLTLSSDYGAYSGVVIVDGLIELQNGNVIEGTGEPNSILMLLSTYDSRSNGVTAINLSNTGNSSFLYANKGLIQPGNSNIFKELTGWGIRLFNSSTVSYETGLAGAFFSSGPSGSYALVKGTYQIK